jgi:transposase InsO family protein
MRTLAHTSHRYFSTFTDGKSRYIFIYLQKTKDKTFANSKAYASRAETITKERINFLRTDGGGEYESAEFRAYLKEKGIYHEKTNADTPQENGVSERVN